MIIIMTEQQLQTTVAPAAQAVVVTAAGTTAEEAPNTSKFSIFKLNNTENNLLLYECTICNTAKTKFTHKKSFMTHKKAYHSDTFEMFICKACKFATLRSQDLTRHLKTAKHVNTMLKKTDKTQKNTDKYIYQKQEGVVYKIAGSEDLIKLLESVSYDFTGETSSTDKGTNNKMMRVI